MGMKKGRELSSAALSFSALASEGDLVVQVWARRGEAAAPSALTTAARTAAAAATAAATATAVTFAAAIAATAALAAVEQGQFTAEGAQHDFGRVFLDA